MKKILLIISIVFSSLIVPGQPSKGNPASAPAPFGFVEVLVVAGAAFGGKKIHQAQKKAEK